MDTKRIEAAVREILAAIGEDPDREGLAETPQRVARMYEELFAGIRKDLRVYAESVFRNDSHEAWHDHHGAWDDQQGAWNNRHGDWNDQQGARNNQYGTPNGQHVTRNGQHGMVMIKDIPFASVCEHHLIPFFGAAHVAYVPREGKIIGLGKIAQIVDDVSKRPQIQERITSTVADVLWDILEPAGVFVVLEAEHLCMSMRGVRKPGARTVTSAARGVFDSDGPYRHEVLAFIGK